MRGFALVFLLLTVTACSHDPYYRDAYPNIPALEQVVVSYSDEMERYDRLFLSDSRAYYDHYIEKVCMKFYTMAQMDIYAGRDLIVHVVEGFLARVNENQEVSEDLYTFPFSADNLCIDIIFDSFYGKYVDTRYLGLIQLKDGVVNYYANDALDCDTIEFHKRTEEYEKAFRLSRFKHYRPWIKIPQKSEYRIRDAGEDVITGGRGRSTFSNNPHIRPARPATPANLLNPTKTPINRPSTRTLAPF